MQKSCAIYPIDNHCHSGRCAMRAAFYTLGCKVNQYETQILQQHFAREGYEIVDFEEEADVYVVNSCTVTATGDKKSRKALRACQIGRAHV